MLPEGKGCRGSGSGCERRSLPELARCVPGSHPRHGAPRPRTERPASGAQPRRSRLQTGPAPAVWLAGVFHEAGEDPRLPSCCAPGLSPPDIRPRALGLHTPPVWASAMAQTVKKAPAMQETRLQSLCPEDPLEAGLATHSGILAWRLPWTEEPGVLRSQS